MLFEKEKCFQSPMFWKNNLDYVHWNVSSGFTQSFLMVLLLFGLRWTDAWMSSSWFFNDFKGFLQNKSLTVLPPFLLFTFLLVPFHFLSCAFYIVGFSTSRPKTAKKYPVHWQLWAISAPGVAFLEGLNCTASATVQQRSHLPVGLFLHPWLSTLPQRPVLSSSLIIKTFKVKQVKAAGRK